jgi:hypothetical protein
MGGFAAEAASPGPAKAPNQSMAARLKPTAASSLFRMKLDFPIIHLSPGIGKVAEGLHETKRCPGIRSISRNAY